MYCKSSVFEISINNYIFKGGSTNVPNKLQQTRGTILTERDCSGIWTTNYNHNVHICIHDEKSGSCNVSVILSILYGSYS